MFFALAGFVLVLAIIIIFSFPQFSPIPYFPSNGKDMLLILKVLNIRNNQTIIDLGAGDGIIIFKAARKAYQDKLNTQFIAVEINPILLLILHVRRFLHPNRKNIRIVNTDMFSTKYSSLFTRLPSLRSGISGQANHYPLTTFYIYISPWFIDKTIANIAKQIEKFDLVSYFYQVKCLPHHKEVIKNGVHKVYSYRSA